MNTLVNMTLDGRPLEELGLRPPVVSVVVISWNYARFIGAAIDSIRGQDYPYFECLVIDNGSRDDSLAVISRHIEEDPRFTVLPLNSNHGTMGAFQIALDHSKGEFVALLDADDRWFSNFLSCHIQVHLALPLGIAFTSSRVVEIDSEDQIITGSNLGFKFNRPENVLPGIGPSEKVPRLRTISNDDFNLLKAQTTRIDPEQDGWFWSPGSGNVYRRTILNVARPQPSERTNFIDVDIHFNRFCHMLGGSAVIDRALSGYRMHGANASNALPSMSHVRTSKRERAESQERQRQEILSILLARAQSLCWLIKDRYWRTIDQQSGKREDALRAYYADPAIHQIIERHLPQLISAFGYGEVVKELGQRLPGSVLRRLIPSDAAQRPPLSPRQEIDLIQLNSFYRRSSPPSRSTLMHRIVFRLDQHFFGQPLARKLDFVVHTTKFNFQRLRRTFKTRLARRSVPGASTLRVAVHGTGSLGDFFSHLMFVQEFSRRFGPMEIDFYAHPKKIADAKFLFASISFVRQVLNAHFLPAADHTYDLIIYLRYLVKYRIINQENIVRHNPALLAVISEAEARLSPYHFIFDNHPFFDGLFSRGLTSRDMNLADVVGYLGNVDVDRNTFPVTQLRQVGCSILEKHGLRQKRYITLHDGFDTSYVPSADSVTKCWPRSHWQQFVSLMKAKFPDILLVQAGSLNAHLIEGVDVDLRSKTSLDEIAWVIKGSLLHVDGESGLVRLAHALHTKSIVIFGPTSMGFFKFDQNINLRAGSCSDCWWSKPDWLSHCPRGLVAPECMESVTPAMVFDQVAGFLDCQWPQRFEVDHCVLCDGQPGEGISDFSGQEFRKIGNPKLQIDSERTGDIGKHSGSSQQWAYSSAADFIHRCAEELGRPLRIADLSGGAASLSLYLAAFLAAKGHAVEVFDLNYFWDRHPDHHDARQVQRWASDKGFKVSYGSIFNVPAESGIYDIVLSISAFEHVRYKEYAVKEALRLLSQDGKLFASFALNTNAASGSTKHAPEVEILTLAGLRTVLDTLGICRTDVLRDREISVYRNRAMDIPSEMTMACLVINRAAELHRRGVDAPMRISAV